MPDAGQRPNTSAVSLPPWDVLDPRAREDLLFLENWERHRPRDLAAALRAGQIRRANPDLAAAVAQAIARPV